MKLFANKSFGEDKIVAGENSVPGVISLIASCNDQDVKNKLGYDLSYSLSISSVSNWLKMDIGIVLLTIKVMILGRGQ